MMKYVCGGVLALACVLPALAQVRGVTQPYHRDVPPPSMYGGYGGWGYGGASTAAGSAMNGMASVISSKGDYNLSTSEAAENLTQAQSKEIQNRQQATNTYFAMQATNKAATKAAMGPMPTMQELTRIAKEAVPAPLDSQQMDPITGGLNWPDYLQVDRFKAQRAAVDKIMAKRSKNGGLSYQDRTAVHKEIATMFSELKANIRNMEPSDYITCRKFLNSLMYAATKNDLQ